MHGDGDMPDEVDPSPDIRGGQRVADAFTALRDRLLGTAYFILGRRVDAEDAVQGAFAKCWSKRHQLSTIQNVEGWVMRSVLNHAKDVRRRSKRRVLSLEEVDVATTNSPQAALERRETLKQIRKAIHGLPDLERDVFLLKQNGELTFQEVAESLEIPIGTAKTRMRSALRRLRSVLREPGSARGEASQ